VSHFASIGNGGQGSTVAHRRQSLTCSIHAISHAPSMPAETVPMYLLHECMNVCMYGWMDEWTDMYVQTCVYVRICVNDMNTYIHVHMQVLNMYTHECHPGRLAPSLPVHTLSTCLMHLLARKTPVHAMSCPAVLARRSFSPDHKDSYPCVFTSMYCNPPLCVFTSMCCDPPLCIHLHVLQPTLVCIYLHVLRRTFFKKRWPPCLQLPRPTGAAVPVHAQQESPVHPQRAACADRGADGPGACFRARAP